MRKILFIVGLMVISQPLPAKTLAQCGSKQHCICMKFPGQDTVCTELKQAYSRKGLRLEDQN